MDILIDKMLAIEDLDTIIKLTIAAFIGVVIGLERELKKKPVGIKTLLVISVGSTLLTIISIQSVEKYTAIFEHVVMDPMRLPAQIVSGIGFIGAGVIWKRSNDVVSGLTTAAIVWGVGGLGIAIGADFIAESFYALILFIIGVDIIPTILRKVFKYDMNQKVIILKLTMKKEQDTKEIIRFIKNNKINIRSVHVRDEKDDSKLVEIRAYVSKKRYVTEIYEECSALNLMEKIDIRE